MVPDNAVNTEKVAELVFVQSVVFFWRCLGVLSEFDVL